MDQVFFCRYWYILIFFVFISCNSSEKEENKNEITVSKKPIEIDFAQSIVIKPTNKKEEIKIDSTQSMASEPDININDGTCVLEADMAAQGLVNIQEIDNSILVELKYSTNDNFIGKDVYGCITKCYLQKETAGKLKVASDILQKNHPSLRLLVYDGGRSVTAQKALWEALPQYKPSVRKTFVADPAIGSIHNYGSAVDLTIADLAGKPLDMGTKYDYFGELAYPKLEDRFLKEGKLTALQVENRKLLRNTMKQAGFMPIEYEWWHFNAVSRAKAKSLYRIIQ
jgi:zinc D-Ala-D-Ala dipeptidase